MAKGIKGSSSGSAILGIIMSLFGLWVLWKILSCDFSFMNTFLGFVGMLFLCSFMGNEK
jgi:hypothetical protein